ncbi:MAG: fec operon regulator FecR [Bacteroidetes bacterium]|nr:fec operon regulator FecR [Bacteroidota bacterium]
MLSNENNLEKSVRFVARHYKPGIFNSENSLEKITGERKRFILRPFVWSGVAAVAVVLIIAGTIFLQPEQGKTLTADAFTTISVLPDETKITLQPGTTLAYDKNFGKVMRRVSLSGNASFEVSPDKEKPFIVHTPAAEITVLGTIFDVVSNENSTQLEVHSGKVNFAPADFPVSFICTKEMKANFDVEQKEITISSTESSCTINQTENRLAFSNSALGEVCRILQQYYNQPVSLTENERNIRLTSGFIDKNITEIIQIINLTLDTHIELK